MKRKMFLWLFSTAFISVCFSQGKTLYVSSMLLPKQGQGKMLETAIMNHTQKYHGTDKMRVFEIISGNNTGMYQLVQGPYSWGALDSLKLGDAHDLDFDTNIATKTNALTGESFVRLRPELSYGSMDVTIEKSRIAIWDVKRGRMDSVTIILQKLKDAMVKTSDMRNMTVYTKMMAGTALQVYLVYRFKNGWTDMEQGKFPSFKDMFIKASSEADWNEWTRMFDDNIEKIETHLRVYRKDISSK
jgi:hypothetical protein